MASVALCVRHLLVFCPKTSLSTEIEKETQEDVNYFATVSELDGSGLWGELEKKK